ncbi:Transposon Tf2-6 polyprotein [Colletotrichum fructicola Nara gc5]|uniref:Transposon Tf2-6 polyprotein n=1 Tax=Colletotrichum fructicola (strain Nara gc5) TaxID=1213859 RepID=A0A7J6J9K4_COLFN|nr:Transposon Tf2-6 polyprotein [Colletotrichum fructicola Nara gc5]KAF4486678.1 Transposon Tf2-6 polyprotein [Colletotrichum fructicola Nara gc5]
MDSPEGSANDAMNAEIDRRINEAVNASIRPLQDQMAQQTAQMTQLLTALNGLMSPDRATPTPLTSSVPTPSTADTTIQAPSDDTVMVAEGRRKPLPNPPKFTGRRKDYPAWSQQMRDKTTLDAGLMGGNAEVWYYINSRLDVDPQQVVATFYAAGGPGGERDPSEFMRYLDRTYKDPSAASRAAATLRTIRQRDDQSLASFLPRYERVLSEAGGASWADQAKITLLEGALSTRLQRALVTVDLPVDNYHGWLMRVQDVAARLERLPATTRRSSSYYPRAPEASRHHDNDGDVVMTGVSRARNKKGAPEPQRRRRYSSSSESEGSEQPQKDSRRCYNCNNIGHIATRCTKPKRPGPKKIKKVKKAKKSEESSNDSATEELGSSEAEESSGKDDIIEWKQFKHRMSSKSAVITARIHKGTQADALVDTGCDLYALVDHDLARRLRLPIVDRSERILGSFSDATGATKATGVVVFNLELCGYDEKIFAYTVRGLGDDLFLGKPWMERNCVVYDASAQQIRHRRGGVDLRLKGEEEPERIRQIRTARLLPGAPFTTLYKRAQRQTGETAAYEVRAISLADIQKALAKKTEKADLKALLPPAVLAEFRELFQPDEAANLPPHRPGVDHEIPIKQDSKGNEAVLPWGPLYGMSREELLVLRKTLRDLLDKGFIRASSSEASAPVLFVRKPGGGIRFCVDYRALNELTKRDRYPLPLIRETLRTISAARWFTKLDVVAAFHKIRIAEGEEHKTAFRTRYGLFEWLVVPFGLTGAPATFQRYINGVLREYLDDFATAYMDDVLIYSNGSQKDHEAKVRLVLRKLADAGLRLDPHKCAFSVKTVKYLGFIVTAGIGISCDPEKLRAIKEWAAPKTVKGVRSFLGFANYYRIFIPAYSNIAGPLIALTKKGAPFCWGEEQEAAFQELKRIFAAKPVLHQLDPELTTYVEADCSGFALGGVLSQEDEHGRRHAVAYHPQTDGGPERMNQEIQAYLRNYVTYSQKDWACNLPAAQLALCSRDNSAIGMSSFFLEHGYNPEPIKVKEADPASSEGTREGQARKLVTRLQDVMDMAQSTLASTQQRYEELANRKRQPTERLEVGDKVWLHMGHYRSPRPCKKLDWLHHKYTVTKVISPYVVELDVPAAIYPRFHVDILKRADDEGEETWSVESIDAATWKRRGRGRRREVLVKWEGYTERTWEPVETLQGTEAMEAYERRYGSAMEHDGDPALAPRARRRRGAGG